MAESSRNSQILRSEANADSAPDEIQAAREVLASLNPGDVGYLDNLDMLADKLLSRFTLSRNLGDLDETISLTKQVLDLAPPGHSMHLAAVSNMGQVLVKRFKFLGHANDLDEAFGYFETAVTSCTPEHSFYLPLVANLSSSLLNRYRSFGDLKDLDRIVENSAFALSACSAPCSSRDALFNNWASALVERFDKLGNRDDLDTALKHYRACLDLRPPGHPLRHTILGNLADAMLCRFEVDGHLEDLESAANHYTAAIQLLVPGKEGFVPSLTSLGVVFLRLFQARGDVEKMEMAIGCYREAMAYSTVPNPDHSRLLSNYGSALYTRFVLFGDVNDLDQSIQHLTKCLDTTLPTNVGWPFAMFHLGTALLYRFNAMGDASDLDASIEKLASALESLSPGYQQRTSVLSTYGGALATRFKARGDIHDLDLATSLCKEAFTHSLPKGLQYAADTANLAMAMNQCCIHQTASAEENQSLIDYCDRALCSVPTKSPTFVPLTGIRAQALYRKSVILSEEADVDASIDALLDVIPMIPKGHAEYPGAHLHLGMALETRFESRADTQDLDGSISFLRIAHGSCTRGHRDYPLTCMYLGNALRISYEFDHGDTLDESIVLLAEAEDIFSTAPGHADYKKTLFNLGSALFIRFQVRRREEDLDAAIVNLTRARTLPSPEGYLASFVLATLLSVRYDRRKDMADLEASIELFRSAAEQMPPKHLVRATLYRHHGHALAKLAGHRDRRQHIDAAIDLYMQSSELLPPSHLDAPLTCQRLAEALFERDDISDKHKAIRIIQERMETLPQGISMRYSFCHTIARFFMTMQALSGSQPTVYLEQGFQYFEEAAGYTHFHSFRSVDVALQWARCAEKYDHPSALRAYQTCLASLNQHLLATASIKSRRATFLDEYWVQQTRTLATDATACAIARGELGLAVELSEQGCGLLWSQMAQSRTSLDALRQTGNIGQGLASDFERVSAQLAQSAVAEPQSLVTASRLTIEGAARRYGDLSKELEDIVARIRQQDGFQSFLDRPTFQSLQCAALAGPVILVNVARRRCDAIIVFHNTPPRLVPLTTTLEDLTTLSEELYHTLKTTSRVGEEKLREKQLVVILRTLWDTVVSPIADELASFLPRGARIWWCPTSKLTSLPLHAAGPYRKGEMNLANMYISSYTPTLAALIRARDRPSGSDRMYTVPPGFVAIGQASPSLSPSSELQTVDIEIDLVRSRLPASMPFSAILGDASTADAALTALNTHGWAHLACHGHPKVEQPFDSSFALGDRAVTVLDIIGGRSEHAAIPEFAFLSACHTAVGDRHAPDEIIHLASAMQFAGFRSVIGTMWAVDDAMVMAMVDAFYTYMFSEQRSGGPDGRPDCTRAARALNKASKAVDKDAVTLDQRIVFVHIGA